MWRASRESLGFVLASTGELRLIREKQLRRSACARVERERDGRRAYSACSMQLIVARPPHSFSKRWQGITAWSEGIYRKGETCTAEQLEDGQHGRAHPGRSDTEWVTCRTTAHKSTGMVLSGSHAGVGGEESQAGVVRVVFESLDGWLAGKCLSRCNRYRFARRASLCAT